MPAVAETWTGSNGAAWAAPWAPNTGAGTTRDIQGNQGHLATTASAFTPGNAYYYGDFPQDFSGTVDCTVQDANANIHLWFRCNGINGYAAYAELGYLVQIVTSGADTLWVRNLGTNTQINNPAGLTAMTANDVYHFKFNVIGSALQVKVWKNADAEPGSWTHNVTNGLFPIGTIMLSQENSVAAVGSHLWDNLSITDLTTDQTWPSLTRRDI
jgi:hypothetical protein